VSQKRDIMVGLFVLIGLLFIGWMMVIFRDLPARLSRYGAWEVTIRFPSASGINVNTPIYFRGYSVGRVVEVKPPAPLPLLDDPEKMSYQVPVIVAIEDEYKIPRAAQAKVYSRGLGSSYLEFIFRNDIIQEDYLNDGDTIQGQISQTSEFIPEATQKKLDQLLVSITDLSKLAKTFLAPPPPIRVKDQDSPVEEMASRPPNMHTLINRLDKTLINFNVIIEETRNLVGNASRAAISIDQTTLRFNDIYGKLGEKTQITADQMALTLKHLDQVFKQFTAGQGTTGRLINDPRLYESLADTTETLKLAIQEFRSLIAELNEHGVIGFKGK
jgi:ABC-type transporter Mla subunit MlaD